MATDPGVEHAREDLARERAVCAVYESGLLSAHQGAPRHLRAVARVRELEDLLALDDSRVSDAD